MGTVASSALANTYDVPANDPNTTNVPYLAWRGENIRFVKCWGTNEFNRAITLQGLSANPTLVTDENMGSLFGQLVQTNVQMMDWSGADTGVNTPKEVINGARTFLSYDMRAGHPVICWQDTWDSNKAGLGQFKLTVSFGINNILGTGVGLGAQVLVMQHQWLAGWMSLNAPTLEEVSSRDHAAASTTQNPEQLGDASGDGVFFAGNGWYQDKNGKWTYDPTNDHPGQLRAVVTGTLPLLQNFSELGLGASIVLPNQWADLAKAMATDANPTDPNPAMRWDIHDEITNMFGETINPTTNTLTGVAGRSHPLTDAVDNAIETNLSFINDQGNARFYRAAVIGGTPTLPPSDSPTAGPFDPNYAEQTLLPDGKLDAGDAPMPAARIDFTIAPNTAGGIDGSGSFVSVSKAKVYSRNDTGTNAVDKNLFAPFYSQWIPATARNNFGYASGVDGAYIANNFNGFLNANPYYHNWTNIDLLSAAGGDSNCYQTVPLGENTGELRTLPAGVQTVAVYSDEHGEARTGFLPGGRAGDDFWFNNLGTRNSNNGCNLNNRVLGTAHITAIARYPYQKVTDPDKTAKTSVDKTILNLYDKHLSYYQKCLTNDSDCKDIKVIVAHAQDINGQPYVGETVCFTGSIRGAAITGMFPDAVGPFNVQKSDGTTFPVNFSGEVFPKNPAQPGFRCTNTDSNGNAVFEVLESEALTANVIAKFLPEGVTRDINVDLGVVSSFKDNPALSPAIVLANGGSTTGTGSNGTTEPSQVQIDNTVKVAVAGGFGIVATPAVTPAAPVQTITPAKTITVTKAAVKVKMLTLRLVRPLHGKAYFLVKVQSPNKTAKITISLKNVHGKTISKFTKIVQANKLIKIKSSLISSSVKKIGLVLVK